MFSKLYSTKVKSSKLDSLLDLQAEYNTDYDTEVKSAIELPPNIGEEVFTHSETYRLSFNSDKRADFNELVKMIPFLSTQEELNLFKSSLLMWRKGGYTVTANNTNLVLDGLFKANQLELILEILCNRFTYSLHPLSSQIRLLIERFGSAAITETDPELHVTILDNMYKSFGLLLYYDRPVTQSAYDLLIVPGLLANSEEGVRRSIVTYKEMQSLGWTGLNSTIFAIALHDYKNNRFLETLEKLQLIKQDTEYKLALEVQTYVAASKLPDALKTLAKYVKTPKSDDSKYKFTTYLESDIVGLVSKAVKESGDEKLISSLETLLTE
ncbi:hypothetical protein BC833DRAFT_568197 [Globomyces pollinis-pini]|nr:hypothetical protein BC833DRAFT_568197 [Globomyces pollinis-pini]